MIAHLLALSMMIPSPAIRRAEASAVVIRATVEGLSGTKYDFAECSGFVVQVRGNRAVIATADHCVNQDDGPRTVTRVQFFDGDSGNVVGVAESAYDDMALIDVETTRPHPAVEPHDRVDRGEALFAFGMPMGLYWSVLPGVAMQGHVPPPDELPNAWGLSFLVEIPGVAGGLSGGPLWDLDGGVVGMVVGGSVNGTGYAIVEPVNRLRYIR